MAEGGRVVTGRTREVVIGLDRMMYGLARHWLALFNAALALYVGLAVAAPLLLVAGYERPANLIYSAYRYVCHQLPSRSEFILGQQLALCQRDVAIYGSLLVGGLLFAMLRRRLKPLPLRFYGLFVAPMAVDGGLQFIGLHTSNLWLRTITGSLFGLGCAWLALPYLEESFNEVRLQVKERLRMT